MTTVRMKAKDTLHISSVGPHNIGPNEQFDVSGVFADDLETRGLAVRVGAKPAAKGEAAPENKAESAPANKAEEAPANKAESDPAPVKTRRRRKSS